MRSKKRLLRDSRLYAIIDKKFLKGGSLMRTAQVISRSGAEIIQLRDKFSNRRSVLKAAAGLKRLLAKTKTIFIINDYPDIAKIVDADGVHLGQEDLPLEGVRRFLGQDKLIGLSCHSLKQALRAQGQGADYIGIGPIFPTSTKPGYRAVGPDLIRQCRKKIKIPFFAIGGINLSNIGQIISRGAKRAAVCKAICQAKNKSAVTRKFYQRLHK